jgi:predicted  nucleic acid-binding Zn-ribbon protein
MRAQLRTLLLLQELDSLAADLAADGGREAEESLGFVLGPLSALKDRRAETARCLDPEVLRRYEQVRRRHRRAVAPARQGVCLGCFTKRPTRTTSRAAGIETCERCGRILFRMDGEESVSPIASR